MGFGEICVLADELFGGQADVMDLIYRPISGLVDSAVAEALMAFWERSQKVLGEAAKACFADYFGRQSRIGDLWACLNWTF